MPRNKLHNCGQEILKLLWGWGNSKYDRYNIEWYFQILYPGNKCVKQLPLQFAVNSIVIYCGHKISNFVLSIKYWKIPYACIHYIHKLYWIWTFGTMWSLALDMINTCFWKLKLEVWVFSCMPLIIISCMTGVLLNCCVDVIEKQHWIAEWTENHFSQQCQHGISGNTLTNPRLIVFPGVYVCRRQTRLIQSQSPLNPSPSFLQVTVLDFFYL